MRITNKMNLPQPIIDAVNNSDYSRPAGTISVTEILNPLRQYILRQRHKEKLVEDASDRIWALMGSNFHYILQKSKSTGLIEQRLQADIEGFKLSGQADLWEDGNLYDYKFTTRYSVDGDVKPEWETQLNLYRYLFEKNGYQVNEMFIVAILRDWSKKQAKVKPDYPQQQVVMVPITAWPMNEVDEYIRERLQSIIACQALADNDLPDCTMDERWARSGKYAVMEKGKKRAKRLLDTEFEADAFIGGLPAGNYYIEKRPAEYPRCEDYCNVAEYCSQWQVIKNENDS